MDGISFLYDISQMSFGFIIMNTVLTLIFGKSIGSPYLIWIIAAAYLVEHIRKKDNSKAMILSLVMLFPCFFMNNSDEIISFILLSICETIVIFIDSVNKDYMMMRVKISTENTVVVVCGIIFILFNTSYAVNILPVFIIIYVISSIILLRNLRTAEFNIKNKSQNKINLAYSVGIILFCIIMSIDFIRKTLFKIVYGIYNIIVGIILIGIKFVGSVIGYLSPRIGQVNIKNSDDGKLDTHNKVDNLSSYLHNKDAYLMNNKYVLIAIDTILIVLVFFILIKLLKKVWKDKKHNEEFVEEREFIKSDVSLTKNLFDKLKKVGAPKDYAEYIRYYYKKFMYKSIKKDVNITDHDTTLQINEKSEKYFNKSLLKDIREIYIKVRYGNEKPSKETKESFYNYYKGL